VKLVETLFDPAMWTTGVGGAALGLVTGHFKTNRGRITRLEKEVEECRERDADFKVLAAGFRMVVGEMMRDNPHSPALQMCGDLLNKKLGPAPSIDEFAHLLNQADEASPQAWEGPRKNWGQDRD
jgi:hypothetical protein